MKKALIISSLALNVIIIATFAGRRLLRPESAPPPQIKEEFKDTYNRVRVDMFAGIPIDSGDIVFVGNSITQDFEVTEMFGPRVKNRGIAWNETVHVLNRITDIAQRKPSKVFIEIGINDMNIANRPDDSILCNIGSIIHTIRQVSPSTATYVQSLLPVTHDYPAYNRVEEFNNKLQRLSDSLKIEYIDLYHKIDTTVMFDGLHLTSKGYRIWADQVKGLMAAK